MECPDLPGKAQPELADVSRSSQSVSQDIAGCEGIYQGGRYLDDHLTQEEYLPI